MRIVMTFLLLSLVTAGGCWSALETERAESTAEPDAGATERPQNGQAIIGAVRHIALEGGFYGIVADDGQRYDPVNLPNEFRRDGLPVTCRARVLHNRASFHMWGQLVEIIDIQRR